MSSTTTKPEGDDGLDRHTSVDEAQEIMVQRRTPLPIKQVFVLCLMRFAEPISFSVIFPFVNEMIEEMGVTSDPKELGYYSGLVEGLFALAQFCTVCYWGSLSDRIGRRPVLISGLCGVVGSTIMFGLSKSFTMMIISRALSGALNGNVAVIKSAMGEITDKTNQGIAFSYLPLCWSLGSLLAPALGGFLSHPAERYPSVFGYELFRRYPYLLPCLAGAAFSTIGLFAGILFLEESLPSAGIKTSGQVELRPLLASDPQKSDSPPASPTITRQRQLSPDPVEPNWDGEEKHTPSTREMLRIPAIRQILVSYAFMALVTVSITAVLVLWLYTPVEDSGVGFDTAEIGTSLAISAIFGTVISVIIFPPLERRVGVVPLFRFGMVMQVLNALAFPLGHAFAVLGGKKGAYLGAATVIIIRCIAGIVFVCNMLLVTRAAPCKRSLGTLNGLGQMVASVSRAAGPALATALFAFSVKSNILGGNLIWLILAIVALLGVAAACQISNDRPSDAESPRCG